MANNLVLSLLLAAFVAACPAHAQTATGVASNTLIVNEVDYDQPSTDTGEFVEIRNISPSAINLSGYFLHLVDTSANTYNKITLPSYSLAAGAYYVVCSTNAAHVTPCNLAVQADASQADRTINLIRNTAGGSVAIVQGTTTIVDSVTLGGTANKWTETTVALADSSTASTGVSRCPNGISTYNNYNDFDVETTTPGAANSCPGYGAAPPPPGGSSTPSPPPPASGGTPPAPASSTTFFMMVNQWIGGWTANYCDDTSGIAGRKWAPTSPIWTLHGLWLNYKSPAGTYPSDCDPNYPFTESQLPSDLLADMALYWPTFSCNNGATDNYFWTHEWSKHGTCAESLFPANGQTAEFNYFNITVRALRKNKVDLYNILKNSGILPGASYSKTSIANAVQSALGVSLVDLHCTSQGYLSEIWVCVDTNFNIISCNSAWLSPAAGSTCPTTINYRHCSAVVPNPGEVVPCPTGSK